VGFFKGPAVDDQLDQYKVLAKRDVDWGIMQLFEAGVAYTDRTKWERESGPGGSEGWFLALKNGATSAPLPETIGYADLSFIGLGRQIAYDPVKAFNSGIYDLIPNLDPALRANNWKVTEEITTAYVQFGLDFKVGTIPVTGTLGTQFVQTDQQSSGLWINGEAVTPVTDDHSYDDWVPSLNLIFELSETRTLRFSVARQLARQAMVDMRAGSTYGFNESLAYSTELENSPWSGSGGNPSLEPWRSDSFDLSFENYFSGNKGYWAIAAFYKDLVSYTYNEKQLTDFTGYPTGSDLVPVLWEGYMTIPQNGSGGSIKGLEGTLSLPGEMLTETLQGFGLILSASYTDSSIQPDKSNPSQPIPGLSEYVVNGTVYFEKGGFAARLSTRYRSEYRGDISTFGPRGAQFRELQSETVLDAQISYSFREGSLEGLTLILQGYNLTDEPLFAVEGGFNDGRYVKDYQSWGRQFSVGASYKF
jgi:iron complex outermembrane receptor protein